MAKVLLGTCDEAVARESYVDWSTNKIGGKPNWTSPRVELPQCPLCTRCRLLVTQLYCPLEASPFHRTLYVFACVSRQCWNKSESWCVIRTQKLDPGYTSQQPPSETISSVATVMDTAPDTVGIATSDWCTDADDWDDDNVAIATTESITVETPGMCSVAVDVSMVMEDNPLMKLVGSGAPCLGECGVTEVTSGAVKEIELTHTADRLRCMQLADSGDCGNIRCREHVEQGNCVTADDSVFHLVKDSILSSLIDPHLSLDTQAAPCQKGGESDVTSPPDECQFVSYYVSVIDEPEKESEHLKHERHLLAEYSSKEGVDLDALADSYQTEASVRGRKGKGSGGGEGYEKGLAKHGDEFFQKFTKRVSLCPQQLLRYSYGGSELYITKPRPAIVVPPCRYCGSERVFELQLMPSLVILLSRDVPIEFGTVLVFTCSRSCWETKTASVREEFVHVQPDPDQHLFKC